MATVTLSDAEYITLGHATLDRMERLLAEGDDAWKLERSDGAIEVYVRKTEDESCPGDILRARTILKNTDISTVEALCMPWLPYRTRWDELLESAETIETLSDGSRLIHHVTKKKLTLSARDSVDIVSIRREPGVFLISSRSTQHEKFPPSSKIVRTTQHLGGYAMQQLDSGDVRFTIFFQCDLNLGGPRIFSSVVDKVKPMLMADKMKNLVCAVKEMHVADEHKHRDEPQSAPLEPEPSSPAPLISF